ncbi:hypothetical protein Ddc_24823 [Ditylenchus destructor]|nr:hypothetical protein Ddc_24823 [Ditylenchus destructor]
MRTVNQKLIDANFNGEERYIRCHKFELLPFSDISSTPQEIAQSLEWLERNVRSDSITLPERMFNRIHNNVKIRALLTNFIFDTSQKCKAQELVFSLTYSNGRMHMKFLDVLIQDFLALPVVQGTIPTVVIDRYPKQEQYRAHLGENLIGREVDSQGAYALYEIENGDKRIRISFCRMQWPGGFKVYLKFFII